MYQNSHKVLSVVSMGEAVYGIIVVCPVSVNDYLLMFMNYWHGK